MSASGSNSNSLKPALDFPSLPSSPGARQTARESSRAAAAFQIGAEAGWTGLGGKGPAGWSSGFAGSLRQKPTQLKSPGTVILRPAPKLSSRHSSSLTPKLSSRHSSSLASLEETSEEAAEAPSALLAAHLAAVEPQEETAVELSSVTDAEKSRVLRAEEVAAEREREVEWLRSELATAQAAAPSDTEVAQQRRSSRLADIDSLV